MSDKKEKSTWEAFTFVSGLGIIMAVDIAAGIFIGNYVDNYFSIKPIGTTIGIIVGLIIGIWSVYKKIITF